MDVRARQGLGGDRRVAFGGIEHRRRVAERSVARQARRLDAGNGTDAIEQIGMRGDERRGRRSRPRPARRRRRLAGNGRVQQEHVRRLEPRVDRRKLLNRTDHQPRAGQQHDRQRDLHNDERARRRCERMPLEPRAEDF